VVVFLHSGCTATRSLTSGTPGNTIVIDAQVPEWSGALRPMENEPFSLGILNDADYLYIALVSHNQPTIMQIMGQGLTFWFDPEGGKEKTLGVRFPTGRSGQDRPGRRGSSGNFSIDNVASYFEVVHGEQIWRYPVKSLPDIDASADLDAGTLILELRVPLTRSANFNFSLAENEVLGLGLETPPLNLDDLRQSAAGEAGRGRGRGGFQDGGLGGVNSNPVGMGGGRPLSPGERSALQAPDQLKLWATVTLTR